MLSELGCTGNKEHGIIGRLIKFTNYAIFESLIGLPRGQDEVLKTMMFELMCTGNN